MSDKDEVLYGKKDKVFRVSVGRDVSGQCTVEKGTLERFQKGHPTSERVETYRNRELVTGRYDK